MPKASSHFWWLPTSLSIVVSTLGIVALARHAFVTWSLSAPLELAMAAYNATMQLLFGWAHPYLQAALTWVGSFIGWRPALYPHWKDVFVVISLIGVGAGRASWRKGDFDTEAFALTVAPILGAAVTALGAGLLPLQSPDLITQLLIAASLGLAFLLFLAVFSVAESEVALLGWGLIWASGASALAALTTWLLSLLFGHVGGLGLAGIASVVVLVGLFLIGDHMVESWSTGSNDKFGLWWGLTILGGFVGAAFVFAVDAGLKLLGA